MTKQQRLVLWISILASFVAFLDGSVINVALPAITAEFNSGLSVQQWVVDAYLITLGSLILVAGSLSDLFGRKRILELGLIGFAITSILCAVAPTSEFLIVSRGLQGIAGALLVPSSLALIISTFKGQAQGTRGRTQRDAPRYLRGTTVCRRARGHRFRADRAAELWLVQSVDIYTANPRSVIPCCVLLARTSHSTSDVTARAIFGSQLCYR